MNRHIDRRLTTRQHHALDEGEAGLRGCSNSLAGNMDLDVGDRAERRSTGLADPDFDRVQAGPTRNASGLYE